MTVEEIYQLAIQLGVKNDFRTAKEIKRYLTEVKKRYTKLSSVEKKYFDQERLINPYADSRIHFSTGKKKIKKILAGIDTSVGGINLAQKLGVDLVFNHHPVGLALAGLDEVMNYQIDQLEKLGIPVNIAEKLLHKRISEVTRSISPVNHYVIVDAAKLLKMNFINIHTPADNCAAMFLTKLIDKAQPYYVRDVLEVINKIPEYQEAQKRGAGPILFSGQKNNRCGKVTVSEFTGGTEGSKEIYGAMANAGVGTIISMHQSEEHRKAAQEANINVIVAGHISSDSLGMNLVLDKIEKKGIEIIPFGGLIRIKRK